MHGIYIMDFSPSSEYLIGGETEKERERERSSYILTGTFTNPLSAGV
jgi:hypothetical protein